MAHKGSVAIIVHNDKILFLLRDNNPTTVNRNLWQLPGGQTEKGETPLETLRRELTEEISMIPKKLTFLGKTTSSIWMYAAFLGDEEVEHIALGNEGQELKFFTLREITNLPITPALRSHVDTFWHGVETLIAKKMLEDIDLLGLTR